MSAGNNSGVGSVNCYVFYCHWDPSGQGGASAIRVWDYVHSPMWLLILLSYSCHKNEVLCSFWFVRLLQISNLGLQLLWHLLHFVVSIWYSLLGIAYLLESYVIASGILKRNPLI